MPFNYPAINDARRRQIQTSETQRTSEVSRIASELVRTTPGLTRTEALRIAERLTPQT